jgi:hypothetical protein
MTAPGNDLLFLVLTLSVLLSSAYAVGRIHQWHKYGLERDEAYRTGYDKASRTIIGMMTGRHHLSPTKGATISQLTARRRARYGGRHERGHRLPVDQQESYPHQREEGDRVGI